MITLPASITAGIAAGVTTIASLWKITRTDAEVFGFTSHDRDIEYGGVTYAALTGYTRTAVSNSSGMASDSVDIEGVLDSATITEADLLAGVWDHARLDLMLIDWALPTSAVVIKSGWFGEVTTGNAGFKAELLGLASALAQNVIDVATPTCRADLGDTRCKLSLATFTFAGTVASVTDRRVFDSDLTNADGYFIGGALTWITGSNAGLVMEIKSSLAVGDISLFLPMPYDIQVGDTFSAYRGCDKTIATCSGTFGNAVNFRGEPYLPGTHNLIKGPE